MTTLEAERRVELRPAPDPRVERAARALRPIIRALGHERDFAIRFWDGRIIRPQAGVEPTSRSRRCPSGSRRSVVDGRLGAARRARGRAARLTAAAYRASAARLSGERHSAARDAAAVQFHYDVGNDFYRLWLDERMVYSCAYFRSRDATLDEAQLSKLDLVLDKLQLRDEMRLLDVGCGWGALLIRAAERYPRLKAVGITLAKEQHRLANERIAAAGFGDRLRVELLDYREAPARLGSFDRIASIGMTEHVGKARMPDYFAAARDALHPGGLFLNHAITRQPGHDRNDGLIGGPIGRLLGLRRSFIDSYVFPDGELLSLAEVLGPAQAAGFEVHDVQSLRPHYPWTLRHWVRRLEGRWDDAVAAAGETVTRTWRLYMAGVIPGFERAELDVHQQLLVLPRADGTSDAPPVRSGT